MIQVEDRTYIIDLSYENAEDFLIDISYGGKLYCIFDSNFIFRGHSTDEYKLLSSVQRTNPYFEKYGYKEGISKEDLTLAHTKLLQAFNEYLYLEDFFRICDENQLYIPEVKRMRELMPLNLSGFSFVFDRENWLPSELYDLAALAQHHGVPTRLLDWTQDIYIALYFAVSGVLHRMQEKRTISQQLKQLKRIAEDIRKIRKASQSKNSCEIDRKFEIWALDKSVIMTHVADNPLRIIHPRYHDNGNLGAQKGLLTFWETKKPIRDDKEKGLTFDLSYRDTKTMDEHITEFLLEKGEPSKPYLYRITLPETSIFELYRFLKRNRCDASTLFPGYDGVARCMKEDAMFNKSTNHK